MNSPGAKQEEFAELHDRARRAIAEAQTLAAENALIGSWFRSQNERSVATRDGAFSRRSSAAHTLSAAVTERVPAPGGSSPGSPSNCECAATGSSGRPR